MERKDFIIGYDGYKEKSVNVGGMSPADRAVIPDLRMVRHEVLLSCSVEEAELLAKGLDTLKAAKDFQGVVGGYNPYTDDISTLRTEVSTEDVVAEGFPTVVTELPQEEAQ